MTAVQIIEEQIKRLTPAELHEFRHWFLDWDSDEWDRQIEQDAWAGKLDALAAEALAEYNAGNAREI